MTTLLVGADGMLGRAFAAALEARGEAFERAVFPVLDLRSVASVREAVRPGIARIVNCAAYTDVDAAEAHEADADAVNALGVAHLAARAAEIGAAVVHFGTDYVFDGRARAPYRVDAPLAPAGAYGRSKARGERALRERGAAHLYVRTSWLYAPWSKNFVRTIAALADARPELRVVDDQRGRPTSAEHLARATLELWDRGARGTFHVTDGGECTWFEFAREVVRLRGASCRVVPCTTAEFPRPAPRPAYSVLNLYETEALLGATDDWRVRLADVVPRLEP